MLLSFVHWFAPIEVAIAIVITKALITRSVVTLLQREIGQRSENWKFAIAVECVSGSMGFFTLFGQNRMGGFRKRCSCNRRYVLKPDVAIASEVSMSSKDSFAMTDFLTKKTLLVNYCENLFLEPPHSLFLPEFLRSTCLCREPPSVGLSHTSALWRPSPPQCNWRTLPSSPSPSLPIIPPFFPPPLWFFFDARRGGRGLVWGMVPRAEEVEGESPPSGTWGQTHIWGQSVCHQLR